MSRIWVVFIFVLCFYVGIFVRLFYWHVIKSDSLKREASSQHLLRFDIPSERGEILFSDGYPVALNQLAYLVYGKPKEMENIPLISSNIASLLSLDSASVSAQLSLPDRVWVPIKHKVDKEQVVELQTSGISGLGYEKEAKRYYPEGSMAAQLLGFVGQDSEGNAQGYFGIEGFYDRELKGKPGSLEIEKDVSGAPILIGQQKRVEPENGRTLVLSIDRSVQAIVEDKLLKGIDKYGAKEGSVVVMDPTTGNILAMASYPSYDIRSYQTADKELYKNPVVAGTYEPGSTFKALVMASALHNNVVKPDTMMDEKSALTVSGYAIKTWNDSYHGLISMKDVLRYSSNVGMVYVQSVLGKEKFIKTIHDFGFGEPTNIDLQDETTSFIRADSDWKEIDLATASFGQGIAVTPIQMVRAMGALANGGWLMEPHVVKEIRSKNGKSVVIKPKKIRRVISEKASRDITSMLVYAVDNGEAKWAKPAGYSIAGKTGTAQIPVLGHYDDKKTIASFIGYAPAETAKFVMLVTLREPSSSQWGSETAAPLFFSIAKELFFYFGIPSTSGV